LRKDQTIRPPNKFGGLLLYIMKFNKENFRIIRKKKKISLKKITAQIGKSYRTLLAWEKGERNPGESDVRVLAQLLNISISEISDLKDFTITNFPDYHYSSDALEQRHREFCEKFSIENQNNLHLKNELELVTAEVKILKKINNRQKGIIDSLHKFIYTKEEEAKAEKNLLQSIINKFEEIVWIGDKNKRSKGDFCLRYFNSKACVDIMGFTDIDLINDPEIWINSIHPEDRNRIIEEFGMDKFPRKSKYRIIHRDDTVKYIEDKEYKVNNDLHFGIIKDISKDKHNSALLKYFKGSVNQLSGVFWIKQTLPEERIIFIGDSIEEIIGINAGSLTSELWHRHILDEDRVRVKKAYRTFTDRKIPLIYRIRHSNGSIHAVDEVWFEIQKRVASTIKFGFIRDKSE
jgi:transcriptional regulator with XRE-family HTH domain